MAKTFDLKPNVDKPLNGGRPQLKYISVIGKFSDGNWRLLQMTPEEFEMVKSVLMGTTGNIKVIDKVITKLDQIITPK